MKITEIKIFTLVLIYFNLEYTLGNDISNIVFGSSSDAIPAGYGDFNSDELTDLFTIRNNFKTLEILLGSDVEPLLQPGPKCDFKKFKITSVVGGDFDGDAFMDLLITVKDDEAKNPKMLKVYVNWGGSDFLNCTDEEREPLLRIIGEPLAMDGNNDMIIDLFGLDENEKRTFWIFNKDRTTPRNHSNVLLDANHSHKLRIPHSHAILDLNNDYTADLFLSTMEDFEVWYGVNKGGGDTQYEFSHAIKLPTSNQIIIGQSLFLDVELKGKLNQLLPICFDSMCTNSSILIHHGNQLHNLHVDFKDNDNVQWGFVPPDDNKLYTNTITLRGGDYNMDGYPDLVLTLAKKSGQIQTFLVENVPCVRTCENFSRTFAVRWKALAPFSDGIVMGAFYDFYQDGILDLILVEKNGTKYRPRAFRNTLDYDANFVKVIVLTGLTNPKSPSKLTPLGRKKRTYGTNLPGPRIEYTTTTQEGLPQHGISAQLPQSAYFSLLLPYTIFGLGRTPNFVDSITVGLANHSRQWQQLIPNSQMIVVPWPTYETDKWKAQLFVTPSKLIIMSAAALGVICILIIAIIIILQFRESRQDKYEKQQEAHRFHFDAM